LRRFPYLLIALALAVASCSSASVAATVNGDDIETSTVESLIDPAGEEVTDDQFRDALTAVIQWDLIADAASDDFGIDPTEDEVLEYSDLIIAAQAAGNTREAFLETQQVTEEGFLLYARQLLIGEQLIERLETRVVAPTEEEAQDLFDADPYGWTVVCAAHILVDTEDEAAAIVTRLEAGEDFATLATQLSIDTGSGASGGDLGCTTPTGWVDEFAEASMTGEIGAVTGPVQSQFGYHLIRVDSRTEATTEQLIASLTDVRLAGIVDDWFLNAITSAEVVVAEEYGTWVTDPLPEIVAPEAE